MERGESGEMKSTEQLRLTVTIESFATVMISMVEFDGIWNFFFCLPAIRYISVDHGSLWLGVRMVVYDPGYDVCLINVEEFKSGQLAWWEACCLRRERAAVVEL